MKTGTKLEKTQDFIQGEILRFSCFFHPKGYNTKQKAPMPYRLRQSFMKRVNGNGKGLETGKKSYDAAGFL
ncbi:MAG: hypothetical protein HFK04_04090 [Oscillospiraceae bacterium]|nr:hypothetical protein [Oscillospiraceae bacterium]